MFIYLFITFDDMPGESNIELTINWRIDMCYYHKSPHLCLATKGQRKRLCGKLFFVECHPIGGQRGVYIGTLTHDAIFFFSNTCQKMRDGKHVKVKTRQLQDIFLRLRADARKLILGSIRTPLDHLSVNLRSNLKFLLHVIWHIYLWLSATHVSFTWLIFS